MPASDININCRHWSDCGLSGGGCCALSLYGGRPSRGICQHACQSRSGTLTAQNIIHGITGITKAATGQDRASQQTIIQRTQMCRDCPHAQITAGVFGRCKLCGCATWAKVRNASERCPAGKWIEAR